jgi:hypothetical protein
MQGGQAIDVDLLSRQPSFLKPLSLNLQRPGADVCADNAPAAAGDEFTVVSRAASVVEKDTRLSRFPQSSEIQLNEYFGRIVQIVTLLIELIPNLCIYVFQIFLYKLKSSRLGRRFTFRARPAGVICALQAPKVALPESAQLPLGNSSPPLIEPTPD